jgi:hypothetical protein
MTKLGPKVLPISEQLLFAGERYVTLLNVMLCYIMLCGAVLQNMLKIHAVFIVAGHRLWFPTGGA